MLRTLSIGLLVLLSGPSLAFAQFNDLQLFGYFQAQFQFNDDATSGEQTKSFSIPQLNLFLNKQFSPTVSAFANTELTNSFSSSQGFGSLRLEEAWVRFNVNRQFRLKAGMLVPTFNNLNDIKNRTPLLPYIFRPVVYESTFNQVLNIGDFAPKQAYLQADGAVPVGEAWFDYAAYLGNSEPEYIATEFANGVVAGNDTTKFFMLGGRVGLRAGTVKIGFSGTFDHDNQVGLGVGSVDRIRIGADLSFTAYGFFVESELIQVLHNLSATQETTLQFVSEANPFFVGEGFDKLFAYGLLGYNVTEEIFAYGFYSYYKDDFVRFFDGGFVTISGGLGYRLLDSLVLKAQYTHNQKLSNDIPVEIELNNYYLALSVFF